MRKYETVLISDPDQSDQARTELFDKVRNIIARENGILLDFDEWGTKKLSYEIRKKLRGHYVCLTYGGTGDLVKELERNLRLSDDCMKFMTILLSDQETAESLQKEAAETAEAKEAKAADEAASEEASEEEAPEAEEKAEETPAKEAEATEEETEKTGETAE
ncbi:MAG TPA: 30S ribosomal protein S6 [Desulfobacteraceae bacterium]|nr:30S ribosomal protein S6 [Desulfobacteraceae bacterium]|tara:strand:- start:225 stop:710 length:486 start_codon:yes stop_codon:yes gene_type:complete